MGFFTKNKKEEPPKEMFKLPAGPEMPLFPELPQQKEEPEFSGLPALPSLPSLPSFPNQQMPEINQIKVAASRPMTIEIGNPSPPPSFASSPSLFSTPSAKARGPIFVKIDKYKDAMESLETIKKRVQETSSLVESIKETRAKEEEELDQWAREIEDVKRKIDLIESKLFGGSE